VSLSITAGPLYKVTVVWKWNVEQKGLEYAAKS